jgi:hypothetical protein
MYKKLKNGRLKHIDLPYGYQPKGFITKIIDGKEVDMPLEKLKIIPPQGGTGEVWLDPAPCCRCPCRHTD